MRNKLGPWFQGTGDYSYCVYDKQLANMAIAVIAKATVNER